MEFNEILEVIRGSASKNPPIGSTVKFNLDDHVIFIDGRGDSNEVNNKNEEAACTITVSRKDFTEIITGKLNPMMATIQGKMRISGDMGLALKLESFM